MSGFEKHDELLKTRGKLNRGRGCLCIRRLANVQQPTLKKLIQASEREPKGGE